MKSLRETLAWAKENKIALGHFNVSDSTQLTGIVNAARELNVPVCIGVSEGERDFFGVRQVAAMVKSLREELDHSVYLNADHTKTVEAAKEAIDAGFDAVIFDGSRKDFSIEENITSTKEIVAYARQASHEVLVEGELGYIGASSKVLDEIPEDVLSQSQTTVADAVRFVAETKIDLLAPAVGNLHGLLKDQAHPRLDIARISEISDAVQIPLVLHGGSGISDDDFKNAIVSGMRVVHINTEIRLAYRKGIEEALSEYPDEISPYRYLDIGRSAVASVVKRRLELFNNL